VLRSGWRGRLRLGIDEPATATNATARAILTAARLRPASVKLTFQSAKQAAEDLQAGRIDAFFVIGAAPLHMVDELLSSGSAKLLPIDGPAITAWIRKQAFVAAVDLSDGTYHGTKRLRTVNVIALWVASAKLPDKVAYSLTRALWNPANRAELDSLGAAGTSIRRDGALVSTPVPLHAGAAKFYQDAGRLQN